MNSQSRDEYNSQGTLDHQNWWIVQYGIEHEDMHVPTAR